MSDKPDLELVIRKLHSDVEQILGVVMPLMQDVAKRGLQADKLDAAIGRLDAGQGRLDAAISRLEVGQERLEAEQKSQRTAFLDELGKTRTDIMSKVAELQGSITGIRNDITVNYAAAYRAELLNKQTRDDLWALTERINGMQLQIQRLQSDVRTLKGEP